MYMYRYMYMYIVHYLDSSTYPNSLYVQYETAET